MLKLFPAILSSGSRSDYLEICGSRFCKSGECELMFSLPFGYYDYGQNGENIIVRNEDSDMYHEYDPIQQLRVGNDYSFFQGELFRYPKIEYTMSEKGKPLNTILINMNTAEEFTFNGDLGYILLETKSHILLETSIRRKRTVRCVSKENGRILWEVSNFGVTFKQLVEGWLVVEEKDHDTWRTILKLYDLDSGAVELEKEFNFLPNRTRVFDDHVVFEGTVKEGTKYTQTLAKYRHMTDTLDQSFPEQSFSSAQLYENHYYSIERELASDCPRTESNSAHMTMFDSKCGKKEGDLSIPNLWFSHSANIFSMGDGLAIVARSRAPWPQVYWQIATFDVDDFSDDSPEVYQEPLMGKIVRVVDGDQSYYVIRVEDECSSFFMLFRQLTVALFQAAGLYGFSRNRDYKEFDSDFNGRLVCDVSNHNVSDIERIALENMKEHLRQGILEQGFVSGYDPEESIFVEVRF